MDTNLAIQIQSWILATFYKEGVLVSFTYCFMFIGVALIALYWAFQQGELRDIESAKFEMMELP